MPSAEYMKAYYYARLAEGMAHLGGECVRCGSTYRLQFDHINPETKLMEVTSLWKNKTLFWAEVQKCQLLCEPHHIEKTNAARRAAIRHGTASCYRQLKCRCESCRIAQSDYKKAWRKSKCPQ